MPTFIICAHRPSRVALHTHTRDLHASSSIGQEIQLRQFLLSQPDWYPIADYHDYGSNARRTGPALRQAVADARTGQFDVLLVARLGPPCSAAWWAQSPQSWPTWTGPAWPCAPRTARWTRPTRPTGCCWRC